jgi:hypothetical protein
VEVEGHYKKYQMTTFEEQMRSIPKWVWITALIILGLWTGVIQVSVSLSIGGQPVL